VILQQQPILIAGKNTFYASNFPIFFLKTHFAKWKKFNTKRRLVIVAWVSK
jgi:hypothetical protein